MSGHSVSADGVASSTTWRIALFAVAACAATATLFASQTSTQQWTQVGGTSSLQTVAAVPSFRMGTLPQHAQAVSQGSMLPLHSLASPTAEGTSNYQLATKFMAPVVLASAGLFLLVAKAMRRLMPAHQAEACSYQPFSSVEVPVYSMTAIAGDDEKQGPSFSRRDMGPLFTGALLSPSLAAALPIKAASAAEAAPAAATAGGIANPKDWIAQNLPGSLPGKEFVRLTSEILNKQGLEPGNTVACVGVCRDELCQPLVDEIESEWGDAFNMTSLAGMLTLGKTGLKAAMAHSPLDEDGKERYFFLSFPHISVDTQGLGQCTRPGRSKPSKACGALYALTSELKAGNVDIKTDPLDPEYSYMKAAILDLLPPGSTDLLEVTKTAAEASLEQMESLIAATVDPKKADYAVCVGVLIHEQDLRPKNAKVVGTARTYVDQVWPIAFYSVKNGRKKDLIWRLERD